MWRSLVWSCLLCGLLVLRVGADEKAVSLSEIVVTPTRIGQDALDLPYATDVMGSDEIQMDKLSRSTPEVLKELPAVMVQKTGHGQGSPFIRGFTGFRTLFLIDGIRLNNSVFRDGPNQYWNTVDSFTIASLELMKGPGSVLYGSDAVGGTVNALMGSPFDFGSDRAWQTRSYYRYSTAEDSHTVRLEGRAVMMADTLGLQAGVSYKNYGDLRSGGGGGRALHTGYDEVDFDAKLEYLIGPNAQLTLVHQKVDQDDVWRTHKTVFGESFHGTRVGSEKKRVLDQERRLSYARLQVSDAPYFFETLDFTLSYHVQREERFRIKKDDRSDLQGFSVNTLGASLQLSTLLDGSEWVYGVEYYRDTVDSFSRKFNVDGSLKGVGIQGPIADDSTYETFGAYVQNISHLGNHLDLILGGRYNYIQADAGRFKDPVSGDAAFFSERWDAFVGSARVLYRVVEDGNVRLFGGVSQGFRAPNFSDLTRLDTARSDELETASTDLDPEKFLAYEVGVRRSTEAGLLEVTYFYTDIEDLIVRTPTGRFIDEDAEVAKKNGGRGFVQGLEFNSRMFFGDIWTLSGNFTWMEGEVDTFPSSSLEKRREYIDRLMPLTGNVGLRVDPVDRFWLEASVALADNQDKLSTRDRSDTQRIPPGGTPGYAVFTMRAGFKVTPKVTLNVAVENIADKNYRVHGSGLNESGRNFVFAVKAVF